MARRAFGANVVDSYGAFTRSAFSANRRHDGFTPVYITAKNEEDDLPATLLALATQREPTFPFVIDNDSEDETAAIGRRMGAEVISVPYGRKMAATKAAVEHASLERQQHPFLLTDADTSPVPTWSGSMSRRLNKADLGTGSAVFGNSLLWLGDNPAADAVLSMAKLVRGARNTITGHIDPRGHNYGVKLDEDGRMRDAISGLDDEIFAGDDWLIYEELVGAGANVVGVNSLKTIVVTRNDRGSTVIGRLNPGEYRRKRDASYV